MCASPVVLIFLVAPFVGEVLSTSTPLVSPYLPVDALLYGGCALLARELVRRRGLGPAGLLTLGAAFGVFQEAVLLRTWFARQHFTDPVVAGYGRVWDTNLVQAVHLTLFHSVVSIWCSVTVVELALPGWRDRAWTGRRGLLLAATGQLGLLLASWAAPQSFYPLPRPSVYLASIALTLLLVAAALRFRAGRRWPRSTGAADDPGGRRAWRQRLLAPVVALAATAHLLLVWSLPGTAVPWPLGIAVTLLPPAAAALTGTWLCPGRAEGRTVAVITGLLVPLLLFDVAVGLGRPDALLAAALGAGGLLWFRRRSDHDLRPG